MATLAADAAPYEWEGPVKDTYLKCGGTIHKGQLVIYSGSAAETVVDVGTATSGFAGVALEGGVAGDRIAVRQVGVLKLGTAITVSLGDEGTAVYAATSGSNNNPDAITTTSTSNMPVGKVNRVLAAGAGAKVALLLEADGFR